MNTAVWIMVMFSYGGYVNTGPEFDTLKKCESAVAAITKSINDRFTMVSVRPPWCVRIEK